MKLNSNNICVPMDFTLSARNALRMAIQIAGYNKSNLYIVHVTKPRYKTQFYNVSRKITAMINRMIKNVLLEMCTSDQNKTNNDNLILDIIVQMGTIGGGIQEIVILKKIDLVILGTSGNNNIFGMTSFSTSLEIAKHLTCSFLTIPVTFNKKEIQSILYPVTDNPNAVYESYLSPLKKPQNLWLHCFTTNNHSQIEELTDVTSLDSPINILKFKIAGINGNVLVSLSISDKIKYFADVLEIDVIVMTHSFVQSFNIIDSKIQNDKMINNSSLPILCLHH